MNKFAKKGVAPFGELEEGKPGHRTKEHFKDGLHEKVYTLPVSIIPGATDNTNRALVAACRYVMNNNVAHGLPEALRWTIKLDKILSLAR